MQAETAASSGLATLAYERPDEDLRAQEAAAVWRVAWWIGLLWSLGAVMSRHWTWYLISEHSAAILTARRALYRGFFPVVATAEVALVLAAAVLLAVLLSGRSRTVIGRVAGAATLLSLLWSLAVFIAAPTTRAQILEIFWLARLAVRMPLSANVLVLAIAALWPQKLGAQRMMLLIAAILLTNPIGLVMDYAYWWSQGETIHEVVRRTTVFAHETISAASFLVAVLLLILLSGSAQRRRWPFLIVAVLVLAESTRSLVWSGIGLYEHVSAGRFAYQMFTTTAWTLQVSAPALALFAWRPPHLTLARRV